MATRPRAVPTDGTFALRVVHHQARDIDNPEGPGTRWLPPSSGAWLLRGDGTAWQPVLELARSRGRGWLARCEAEGRSWLLCRTDDTCHVSPDDGLSWVGVGLPGDPRARLTLDPALRDAQTWEAIASPRGLPRAVPGVPYPDPGLRTLQVSCALRQDPEAPIRYADVVARAEWLGGALRYEGNVVVNTFEERPARLRGLLPGFYRLTATDRAGGATLAEAVVVVDIGGTHVQIEDAAITLLA